MTDEERCPECGGYRTLPRILHDQDEPRECSHGFHKSETPAVLEFPSSEPKPQSKQPEPEPLRPNTTPVCPYCGCEGRIRGSMTSLGGGKINVFAVYCGNNDCRKYLGFFQPLQLELMPPPTVV